MVYCGEFCIVVTSIDVVGRQFMICSRGVLGGVWCLVCGGGCVGWGVWCVVCGVWCVLCGVWGVVCLVFRGVWVVRDMGCRLQTVTSPGDRTWARFSMIA